MVCGFRRSPAGQTVKVYRGLVTISGRRGNGLSSRRVRHVHSVLRPSFDDPPGIG